MRTIEDIQAELAQHQANYTLPEDEFLDDEVDSHERGYQGGLDKAIELIRAGYDSAALIQHAWAAEAKYQYGFNASADAWHVGWRDALRWAGEDSNYWPGGDTIMRP